MQLKMFTIYDSKANAFLQPWFLTTEALAVRAFSDLANDQESNVSRHADDYTLFKIGTFNDATAKVDWTTPVTLGCALQYKKPDDYNVTEHTINDYERRLIELCHDAEQCDDTIQVRQLMRRLDDEELDKNAPTNSGAQI